jgi:hypothetical protein
MWVPNMVIDRDFGTPGWQTYEQLPDGYGRLATKLHVQAIGIIAWALWSRSRTGTEDVNEHGGQVEDASQLPCSAKHPSPV